MKAYILRRLLQGLVVLVVVGVSVFALARLTGNPIDLMLPEDATQADRDHMAKALGLDQPYYVQFYTYIGGIVRGDFGDSTKYSRPASEIFFERLPNSLRLIGLSYFFAILIAIPLAVSAARNRGKPIDTLAKTIAVAGMATPTFWMGLVLIQIFAVRLMILPVATMGGPSHYILPAFTLGYFQVAGLTRLLRSSMLEMLDAEFVKLARIKGVSERVVVWRHSLRNALIPVVSFAGVYIAILITGAIVVETVFAWPGVGRLAYEAVMARDFPVIQAVVTLKALFIVVLNIVVDVIYAYLNPRIRYA
ncbi:ABC transporter permease [Chloroflexota bacterium]